VRRGNKAYEAKRYDEAMKAYEQADVESPESPVIAFDKGAAQYRAEDFGAARESFEKAAKGSRDPLFEAKCRYNLGDCWFREVRRQMDSDLGKAVEACERSVDEFQAALALDPTMAAARRNIEVVRRLWKTILDEQKRRQEEQKAQQEQAQKLAEQLKQLIERQDKAAGQSAELAQQQASGGTTPAVQQQSAAQAEGQRQLGQDTQALADTLQQSASQAQPPPGGFPGGPMTPSASTGGPAPSSPPHPAVQHMADARQAQDQATEKLGQTQPEPANADQKQAAEALRKALESMSQEQQGQQGQKQQQEQEQEQEQGKEQEQEQGKEKGEEQQGKEGEQEQEKAEQAAAEEGGEQDEESKDRPQAKARLADQDARDILDDEKRNRERRTAAEQRGITPVDKDW
jgi:hypothetical protein